MKENLANIILLEMLRKYYEKQKINFTEYKDVEKLLEYFTEEEITNFIRKYKIPEITLELLKRELSKKEIGLPNKCVRYFHYHTILGHNAFIERMITDYNKDKTFLFTGGNEGYVKIWDIDQGVLIRSLYGHRGIVLDISISFTGSYLVTADTEGIIIVWNMHNYTVLHKIELEGEVMFCEFVRDLSELGTMTVTSFIGSSNINSKTSNHVTNVYNLVALKSNGVLYAIRFTEQEYTITCINKSLENEVIGAICISEGGRFLCCAGLWSYLILFDTYDPSCVICLQDFGEIFTGADNLINGKMTNITASRKGFTLAAAYGSTVYLYKYSGIATPSDGNHRFTFSKTACGCFNKEVINLNETKYFREEIINNVSVVNIALLYGGNILVVSCDDSYIRIYDKSTLVTVIKGSKGHIYTHPSKNIFAVVESKIEIFELVISSSQVNGNYKYSTIKIFEHEIIYTVSDLIFSNNGNYFIFLDDSGRISTYSMHSNGKPSTYLESQFFELDFDYSLAHYIGQILQYIKTSHTSHTSHPSHPSLINSNHLLPDIINYIKKLVNNLPYEHKMFISKFMLKCEGSILGNLEDVMYGKIYNVNKEVIVNKPSSHYIITPSESNFNNFLESFIVAHFKSKKITGESFRERITHQQSQTFIEELSNDQPQESISNIYSESSDDVVISERSSSSIDEGNVEVLENSNYRKDGLLSNRRIIDSSDEDIPIIIERTHIASSSGKNKKNNSVSINKKRYYDDDSDSTTLSDTTTDLSDASSSSEFITSSSHSESGSYQDGTDDSLFSEDTSEESGSSRNIKFSRKIYDESSED